MAYSKTAKAKRVAARIAGIPESAIDCSEIPELTEEQFTRMIPLQEFWKARKKQITLRVDADVLDWYQKTGAGYLTRMNDALRKAMTNEIVKPAKTRRR